MFDEPRRLPTACVAQIFAWLPQRDWFAFRRAARRLLAQSATEGARPTRFQVRHDRVGLAHAHRPRALTLEATSRGNRGTRLLPAMTYLERLSVYADLDARTMTRTLARLVHLQTLQLHQCAHPTTAAQLDFSALRALTHLELDERRTMTAKIARTLPRSLRSLAASFCGSGPERMLELDVFPHLQGLTALHLRGADPDCEALVAGIVAHMPRLVQLTIPIMNAGGADDFAQHERLNELGAVADRHLRAISTLRQIRRLAVYGNALVCGAPTVTSPSPNEGACSTLPLLSSSPPPPSPSVPPPSALALVGLMPALERLDLSGLVVHCRGDPSFAAAKTEFEASMLRCRSVAAPVWQLIS